MFWSQVDDYSINNLFTKENVTLEEILDHDSLLQECKLQNEKLINFLSLKTNFCVLLDYVLVTPNENIEEKVRFKYPSLISEVLTSDVSIINEFLIGGFKTEDNGDSNNSFSDMSFVNRFLDKLEAEMLINPLTLSFLIKILLNILKHNNDSVMKDILQRKDSLDLFLKHIDNNAIIVFFTEFLMCEEECTNKRIQWLKQEDFAYKCSKMLTVMEYRSSSIQALLCEVIGTSWRFMSNKEMRDEIHNQLNGQEFLDVIFGQLSNPKSDCNLITSCLRIIRTIIDFETESESDRKLTAVKDMVLKHFYSLMVLLSSPPKQLYDPMPTTIGKITPFGPTRLEIVYLLESILKLKDSDINKKISQTNIFMVLLSFLSQYKWNTLLQIGMLRIFDLLFTDLTFNCHYLSLLQHLVNDYDIYHWFIEIINDTAQLGNPRPGTMGLLWKIGNHLQCLWDSELADELINKDNGDSQEWSEIVDLYLRPRNKDNAITPPKIDNVFKDIDAQIVDIDEDDSFISTNPDVISKMFENGLGDLDDIFGGSYHDDCDDWIESELRKGQMKMSILEDGDHDLNEEKEDEDSSSDEEESPAVIRQKSDGTAAKYLQSGIVSSESRTSDLMENGLIPVASDDSSLCLYQVPILSPAIADSCIKIDDVCRLGSSPEGKVPSNWSNM